MKKTIFFTLLFFLQLFTTEAQVDSVGVKKIVNQWNEEHNTHNTDNLGKLFSDSVLFYCKKLPKAECIKILVDAFQKAPNFKQQIISKIEITSYESGIIKCDFIKEVNFRKTPLDYPAYLLIKQENNNYLILGEGDKITDANLNYTLNLGKLYSASEHALQNKYNYVLYSLIGALALLLIFIISTIRLKSKYRNAISEPNFQERNTVYVPEPIIQSPAPNPELIKVKTEYIPTPIIETTSETITNSINENKTREYLKQGLSQTKTFLTKLFDTIDSIDRKLYGKRMRFFVLGSILVLVVAPVIDVVFSIKEDRVTFYSTFVFFLFILVLFLSLISSWRDDTGNWSFKRVLSKLKVYFESAKDTVATARKNTKGETLYKLGTLLFFIGVGWKALQNVSVFVRKPVETFFGIHLPLYRKFEKATNSYCWIPFVVGLGILIYLYNQNPQILQRIKNELRELFGLKASKTSKYTDTVVNIARNPNSEFVINSKQEASMNEVILNSKSNLFQDFATALQNWNPRGAYYEYEYQDRLAKHLRKLLPDASVETEFPIGDKAHGNRGRADIVVNETILIEMKRDSSAGAIQRAKGQISQYSEIWQNKGPVILLLCDYEYEHAKLAYHSTMSDLATLNRPVITIVANPKKTTIR